jgi:anti-sigma factor RsiW
MKRRSLISMLQINCREASELISAAADGELPRRDRIALRIHLILCTACKRFAAQLSILRAAMSAMPRRWRGHWCDESAQLSSERRQAIKQLLAQANDSELPS